MDNGNEMRLTTSISYTCVCVHDVISARSRSNLHGPQDKAPPLSQFKAYWYKIYQVKTGKGIIMEDRLLVLYQNVYFDNKVT